MSKHPQCAVMFEMDGKQFGFNMPATSWDDAERRLQAIRLNGRVTGFPCYSVRMPGPLMYLALPLLPLITGFLNLFSRPKR